MNFGRLGFLGLSSLGTRGTGAPVIRVAAPTVTSPADSATDIGETPDITSSAFAVTNGGSDTHASSDWQVATDSAFSSIVVQSLSDATNKTSWTVPSGNLSTSTQYYVRVRHNGTTYGASSWSAAVSFTTASAFAYAWTNAEGSAFEAQADTTGWDDALRSDIDQLISDLKSGQVNSSNTYSGFDRILLMDLPNQSDSLRYLNAPTLTATAVNIPTFTPTEGFTGDGSTAYIDTGYNPATDGVQFSRNSNSLGVWVRDVGTAASVSAFVGASGSSSQRLSRIGRQADGLSWFVNSSSSTFLGSTLSEVADGLLGGNRSASNAYQAYRNGAAEGSNTAASEDVPPVAFALLANNQNGSPSTFSNGQVSIWFVGRSFTANEQADIYDAFNRYRTAREAA